MSLDFTFDMYEKLLTAGNSAGYDHITISEYLSTRALPDRFIIHRHDVDRKPENALTMAKLEAKHGVRSTYYFRTIDKTFKPTMIADIAAIGHEIGYHYEDMDRTNGQIDHAHQSFESELGRLRTHATVSTACMHGNPLTKYDNRDMWNGRGTPEDYNLVGEAYLDIDFTEVMYYSDTGRTWKDGALKIKDYPIGGSNKSIQIDTTVELCTLIESKTFDQFCILSHPNRWAKDINEYVIERAKDLVTNVGKRGIAAIR